MPVYWVCQDPVNMEKCGKKCAEAHAGRQPLANGNAHESALMRT